MSKNFISVNVLVTLDIELLLDHLRHLKLDIRNFFDELVQHVMFVLGELRLDCFNFLLHKLVLL